MRRLPSFVFDESVGRGEEPLLHGWANSDVLRKSCRQTDTLPRQLPVFH